MSAMQFLDELNLSGPETDIRTPRSGINNNNNNNNNHHHHHADCDCDCEPEHCGGANDCGGGVDCDCGWE